MELRRSGVGPRRIRAGRAAGTDVGNYTPTE